MNPVIMPKSDNKQPSYKDWKDECPPFSFEKVWCLGSSICVHAARCRGRGLKRTYKYKNTRPNKDRWEQLWTFFKRWKSGRAICSGEANEEPCFPAAVCGVVCFHVRCSCPPAFFIRLYQTDSFFPPEVKFDLTNNICLRQVRRTSQALGVSSPRWSWSRPTWTPLG